MCGVKHKGITNNLLNEKNLAYEKDMEVAEAMESAEKDTRYWQTMQSTPEVHHNASQQSVNGVRARRNSLLQDRDSRHSAFVFQM